jgi:alpha amylase-like protein
MPRSATSPASPAPRRWAEARHPFVYEINTWPWLAELSSRGGQPIDLATVPEQQWDAIAEAGFDAVWLMGVWTRSPAGVAVALANPELVDSFRSALPDWVPADVVGSAYCIRDYDVEQKLGGREGLSAARSALAARGLGLILDFVPNHVALDHPWTAAHPEYFVHGSQQDLHVDPDSFVDVGDTVLANGRDPYFPAWRDVVQLNAFSPAFRAAAVDTLRDIADQCDGVRCDMAMLMVNATFARTWGERVGVPPDTEFWPATISAVRHAHPDFTFLAEAYWDTEALLQQQGFDFCYDKRLYDLLVDGDAAAVREHLAADPGYQDRLVRFVENHDEPRAAALFDAAKQQAVTVAALTQTGARLVYRGQLDGAKVHLPVFLGRAPHEDVDVALASFHCLLLTALRDNTFRTGDWCACETSGWPGNDSSGQLVSWCWDGAARWLVVVNLGSTGACGHVRVPWDDMLGRTYRLMDPTTGVDVIRSGDDLNGGLYVELGPWRWHLFEVERVPQPELTDR